MEIATLFFLVILIFSIIIHEIAHGVVADQLGDPTARLAGRLTLNPVPHIDPLGSIILPALMLVGSSAVGHPFAFGWAKPVPYNPYNLRHGRLGVTLVGVAGVAANFLIAIIFGLMIRFHAELGIVGGSAFYEILGTIVWTNIILGVFNLIPIPPLDGAKVLFSLLPQRFEAIHDTMERNWIVFLVFVFFFAQYIILPISGLFFSAVTGQ
ncbi:MAG: site-2 protease family protein [Patescibacteria group bacterium]